MIQEKSNKLTLLTSALDGKAKEVAALQLALDTAGMQSADLVQANANVIASHNTAQQDLMAAQVYAYASAKLSLSSHLTA